MKVKEYLKIHPEIMESHNLNDMFIILSISKLIDSIHNRIFRRELENAIIDKIIKLEEKEICID